MIEPYSNLTGKKALIFVDGQDILLLVDRVTKSVIYGKDEQGRNRKIYKKVVTDYLIME